MSVIFDIGVIAIIALSTFIGYKQGLVKSAIKILSFFIAIIVALALYKPVSNLIINNTSIDDDIKNAIIDKIMLQTNAGETEFITVNNIGLQIIKGSTNTVEEVAQQFAVKLIEIITLLLIFIIIKIVLRFISALTDLITKIPILKQVNKLGGTIYGIIKGVILVYTILAIVYLITPLFNDTITDSINKTIITKTLYNNNLILNIIV